MRLEFSGVIWYWRGPSPFYFVSVPQQHSRDLKTVSGLASYGWGVIPVHARIGKTAFQTSLIPKDGVSCCQSKTWYETWKSWRKATK